MFITNIQANHINNPLRSWICKAIALIITESTHNHNSQLLPSMSQPGENALCFRMMNIAGAYIYIRAFTSMQGNASIGVRPTRDEMYDEY